VGAMFKKAGFEVVESKLDLGNTAMRRAIREFTGTAKNADIAVVYYAGHGIEFDGTNYLIPVDAELASDVDVEDETISLDRVMRMLDPVKRLRLVILAACSSRSATSAERRSRCPTVWVAFRSARSRSVSVEWRRRIARSRLSPRRSIVGGAE